jgi:hypothetical protein
MAELKTKQNDADVFEFIETFASTEQKKKDAYDLLSFMQKVTGYEPKMWGPSIIGFGSYHYKSDRSKQEGDWPLVGFSPRKAAISLYVYGETEKNDALLEKFGKFKKGVGCIYVKKLSDIDLDILRELMFETIRFLKERYPDTK